jgi:hypothetical protein
MRISGMVFAAVFGLAFGIFAATSAMAQATGEMPMEHAGHGKPSTSLTISYEGKSKTWTVQDLPKLPPTAIEVYNAHTKATEPYFGVPLIDLLKTLGVPDKPHGKDFQLYLVAEGTDGYQVVYSIGEVTPDVHDGTVLVAYAVAVDSPGSAPLPPESGAFQLVATGEKRPARWVRNLTSIRVLTAK